MPSTGGTGPASIIRDSQDSDWVHGPVRNRQGKQQNESCKTDMSEQIPFHGYLLISSFETNPYTGADEIQHRRTGSRSMRNLCKSNSQYHKQSLHIQPFTSAH